MGLYRLVQVFMAPIRMMKGATCGMSGWVFISIRGYRGVALRTLILFAFLASVGTSPV